VAGAAVADRCGDYGGWSPAAGRQLTAVAFAAAATCRRRAKRAHFSVARFYGAVLRRAVDPFAHGATVVEPRKS